jgi:hypothetical protein
VSLTNLGFDIDDPELQLVEGDDGGIYALEPEGGPDATEFGVNLAECMGSSESARLVGIIEDGVQNDRASRVEWEDAQKRGIELLGFDRAEDVRSTPFQGSSGVVHPSFAMACVDFQSRTIRELLPPEGPVKIEIVGPSNDQIMEQGERVKETMNAYAMTVIPEYASELEKLMMNLPVSGTGFRKLWWDRMLSRPCAQFVPADEILVPYGTRSLETAARITHVIREREADFDAKVTSGIYCDVPFSESRFEANSVREASDEIEGVQPSGMDDGYAEIWECHIDASLECDPLSDGEALPYIVTVLAGTGQLLNVYRNWRPEDRRRRRRDVFVDYGVMPWRGFYSFGLTHMIGGLAVAATGALRALLDAAHRANAGGGVVLKGVLDGQNIVTTPGVFVQVDASGAGLQDPDVRKLLNEMPGLGSSPVLFQLLGFLTESAGKFASIATEIAAEANNNAPVGTTLALIEEGSRQFSAIFARLHRSQTKELSILFDLLAENLTDELIIEEFGSLIVRPQDFTQVVKVLPVSDPAISSTAQRLARDQLVMSLAEKAPQFYDMREVHKRILRSAGIPDIDAIMPDPDQAVPLDPVSEFGAVIGGKPTQAFPGQAHDAHIQYLMAVGQDPQYQPIMPVIGPRLQALIAQHMAMNARAEMDALFMDATGEPLPPPGQQLPPPMAQALAQAMAKAQADITSGRLAQAQQAAQQQGSGMDALAQAAIEEAKASMADVQRKAADDVSKAMLAKEKQEVETARLLAAAEADRQKIQIQAAQDMAKFQAEQQETQADNDFRVQQLEVELAKARIAQETVIAKTAMELDQKTQAAADQMLYEAQQQASQAEAMARTKEQEKPPQKGSGKTITIVRDDKTKKIAALKVKDDDEAEVGDEVESKEE